VSKPVQVTDQNFEQEVLQAGSPVLVDFWAEWCQPCKRIAPIVDELAEEYAGRLKVGKCDADTNPQTVIRLEIQSIPTLILFNGGERLETIVGVGLQPKARLREILKRHLA
jgi:thioredoxin 1